MNEVNLILNAARSQNLWELLKPLFGTVEMLAFGYAGNLSTLRRRAGSLGFQRAQQSGLEDCWEPGPGWTHMVQPYYGTAQPPDF